MTTELHVIHTANFTSSCYCYAYSEVGNRTALTTTTDLILYQYDAANRLTRVNGVTYTWGTRGNLTSDGVFTYTYNAAGKMVRAQGLTLTLVYTYNGDGLLAAQRVNGTLTTFVWDQTAGLPQVLATSDGALDVYGLGRIAEVRGNEWRYPLGDALGSVRQAADGTGAVTVSREWTPYGEEVGGWRAGLGYTGEWQDGMLGLVYLRARWYAPGVGRFTQPDPWEGDQWQPITLQPYLYTGDSPTNRTDPSGLYGKDDVHYQLTLEIAQSALGHLGVYGTRTAWLIARGNQYMDDFLFAFRRQSLHFTDWPVAHANAERAIQMRHPYVFGATLHQIQDYFSHYYEGFRFPGEGHARYNVGRRPSWTIHRFFARHPRSWVESRLSLLYPGIDFSGRDQVEDHRPPFTDNELIDLYLREWRIGLSRREEWEEYGYNTDWYFPHTYRDQQMERETRHFIQRFAFEILRDPCRWYGMMERGEDPEAVREFFDGE